MRFVRLTTALLERPKYFWHVQSNKQQNLFRGLLWERGTIKLTPSLQGFGARGGGQTIGNLLTEKTLGSLTYLFSCNGATDKLALNPF